MSDARPLLLPATIVAVGVSNYQDEVTALVAGQALRVDHEPDNAYDSQACVVRTVSGATVGYLPRALAPRLLAAGPPSWDAQVSELRPGETWGVAVRITGPAGGQNDSAAAGSAGEVPGGARAAAEAARDGAGGAAGTLGSAARRVYTRSGRDLGVFVRHDPEAAKTYAQRDPSGVAVGYPDELVEVRDPVGVS